MGQDTEGLTTTPADIDATRANLSRDIDELTDKVSPARVVERRKEAAKQAARGRIGTIRDKVMGVVPTGGSGGSGHGSAGVGARVSGAAGSAAGSVSDTVSDSAGGAVDAIGSKAQGNPLAAGLIAFGAGMVISALIPASEKEAEVAQRAVEAAKEHGQPVVDEAKSVGQQMGQELKESATESAQQVKDTAQDSVQNVKQQGQSSAQTVKDQATPSG
jgi:gas vesicle protein